MVKGTSIGASMLPIEGRSGGGVGTSRSVVGASSGVERWAVCEGGIKPG